MSLVTADTPGGILGPARKNCLSMTPCLPNLICARLCRHQHRHSLLLLLARPPTTRARLLSFLRPSTQSLLQPLSHHPNLMSYHSPHPSQSQFHFDSSTPPPPPPKPSTHSSGRGTPLGGPPLPPTPTTAQTSQPIYGQPAHDQVESGAGYQQPEDALPQIDLPEDGWLPEILKDKKFTQPSP